MNETNDNKRIRISNTIVLLNEIRSGNQGKIFLARNEETNRYAAVKKFDQNFINRLENTSDFERKLGILEQLNHKNIIKIQEYIKFENDYYIVMELFVGRTLKNLMAEKRKLETANVLDYLDQILQALKYAHQHGVFHADIKPSNVMINDQGIAKVLDFGFADEQIHELKISQEDSDGPYYFSSEYIELQKPSVASDIYSVNALFYKVLTGNLPYYSQNSTLEQRESELVPPRTFDPKIPKILSDLLVKGLNVIPEERYHSADEMLYVVRRVKTVINQKTTEKEDSKKDEKSVKKDETESEPRKSDEKKHESEGKSAKSTERIPENDSEYIIIKDGIEHEEISEKSDEDFIIGEELESGQDSDGDSIKELDTAADEFFELMKNGYKPDITAMDDKQPEHIESERRYDADTISKIDSGVASESIKSSEYLREERIIKKPVEKSERKPSKSRSQKPIARPYVKTRTVKPHIRLTALAGLLIIAVIAGAMIFGGSLVKILDKDAKIPSGSSIEQIYPDPPKNQIFAIPEMMDKKFGNVLGIEFKKIPSGSFTMGLPAEKTDSLDESPPHEVYLSSYFMSKYEITNYQYAMFIQDTGHKAPVGWEGMEYLENTAYLPVTHITWYEAYAFSGWLSKKTGLNVRLPTEAQWERISSAGGCYPWGDNFQPDIANLYTAAVGNKSRIGSFSNDTNQYEIMDIGGNVREWILDNYSMSAYAIANRRDPMGPPSGQKRVVRGGSYHTTRDAAISTHRDSLNPDSSYEDLGFRLVIQP